MDQPLGRLERFDVNSVTRPIAALILPEHDETLLEPGRSDTNLAFVGRLLRVRSLGDAYHPKVGTSSWSVYARFDDEADRNRLWLHQTTIYLFPLFWGNNRNDKLLLALRYDGTFRRLGVAEYWVRTGEYIGQWGGVPPPQQTRYQRARPRLIVLS